MRKVRLGILCVLASMLLLPAQVQASLDIKEFDGGPVITNLSSEIAINEGSSLVRKWFVINDSSCPIELTNTGIETLYHNGSYLYRPSGNLRCRTAIAAFEIRFMLFDIWEEHMSTLSGTAITDLESGVTLPLRFGVGGPWPASWNGVSVLFIVVTFVAHVRNLDGSVWIYNTAAVREQVESVKLELTEEALSPSKQKELTR